MLNIYVIVTLFCWSFWGIFDKKALHTSTQMGVLARLYLMSVWQAPLFYAFVSWQQPHFHINSHVWLWALAAAVSRLLSFAAYFFSMSIADASLVLGVTATYPLVTQILAIVCLGDKLIASRAFGTLAITIGVMGIGSSQNAGHTNLSFQRMIRLWVCIAIATLGWGVWGIFDKLATEHGDAYQVWLAETTWEVVLVAVLSVAALVTKCKVEFSSKPTWWFVFLSSLCLAVGKLTYLASLSLASVSYVITITACYPLLMYLLALALLKEKFNVPRFLGIVFVVAGGVAVQLAGTT